MADSIEHFDEKRNMARVAAGFAQGPFFKKMAEAPVRTFVDGWPPEIAQMIGPQTFPQPTPIDPWGSRRR